MPVGIHCKIKKHAVPGTQRKVDSLSMLAFEGHRRLNCDRTKITVKLWYEAVHWMARKKSIRCPSVTKASCFLCQDSWRHGFLSMDVNHDAARAVARATGEVAVVVLQRRLLQLPQGPSTTAPAPKT